MKTNLAKKTRASRLSNGRKQYIDPLRQFVATVFVTFVTLLSIMTATMPQARAASPSRIVSLSLASDEILMDMLPACGGLSRIAGLSIFVDDPAASSVVEAAKTIKGRVHSEPESLFSLKPDLVIAASFNRPELIRMVRDHKIPLFTLDTFSSALDIIDHIQKIGDTVNCPKEAATIKAKFMAEITPVVPPKIPTRVINYSPDLTVMGKNTLFDDLVTRAGGVNAASVAGLSHWPKIDTETLLKLNPDKIIILGDDSSRLRKEITSHAAWGRLDAVKKNQFIFLKSKTALSTSHYFGQAVVELRGKFAVQVNSLPTK